jgi:aldehyde dehydrogenase (NAD(P)+)
MHGSLGVNLIIHPKTIKELGPALDEAIAELKFGSIGINAWTGVNYLISQNSWGAYPGHKLNDIQSGRGVVHNTFLFDKPQKSVARGLFYPFPRCLLHGEWHFSPKPAWFVTNKQAHVTGRRFTYYEANPGIRHLPGIFISALRG